MMSQDWTGTELDTQVTNKTLLDDNIQITQRIREYDQLELKAFEHTDHNILDLEQDIDPAATTRMISSTRTLNLKLLNYSFQQQKSIWKLHKH